MNEILKNWEEREAELQRRHEEIVIQREAILCGTERYYDSEEARSLSFITDYKRAKQRNEDLIHAITDLDTRLHDEHTMKKYKQFLTTKSNYWSMVRNVFPVWYEEQKQWESRHQPGTFTENDIPSARSQGANDLKKEANQYNTKIPSPPSQKKPVSQRQGTLNSHAMPTAIQEPQAASRRSPRPSPRRIDKTEPIRSPAPVNSTPNHQRTYSPTTASQVSDRYDTPIIPRLELDYSMGEDVTTLSQVSAIPHSAQAVSHNVTTPPSAYQTQAVGPDHPGTKAQATQVASPSTARDDSDNWAYTSHTPRPTTPRAKSPPGKSPRGKSPRAKSPRVKSSKSPRTPVEQTPKSALASGNKGKGKKVQIQEHPDTRDVVHRT